MHCYRVSSKHFHVLWNQTILQVGLTMLREYVTIILYEYFCRV